MPLVVSYDQQRETERRDCAIIELLNDSEFRSCPFRYVSCQIWSANGHAFQH